MHMYTIKKNVKCKLLLQEPDKDIQISDWTTTKDLEFGDEQLIIDYAHFKNSGAKVNSIATKLASQGYYIFCNDSVNDKYLIAVLSPSVEVL